MEGVALSVEKIEQIPTRPTAQSKIPGIHESRKEVVVSRRDWENVKKTAAQFPDPKLRAANKRLEEEKIELQRTNAELQKKIPSMTERLRVSNIEKENAELKRYIARIPEEVKQTIEYDRRQQRRGQNLDFDR